MTFGERLRRARLDAKLTQDELGDLAGCGQGVISKIERGDQDASTYTVKLASILKVSPYWLDDGSGDMRSGRTIDELPKPIQHMIQVTENMEAQEQYLAARLVDTLAKPEPMNGTQ